MGSPPPTRGTPFNFPKKSALKGITPAYAGNTETDFKKVIKEEDHPRLRGEHPMFFNFSLALKGSPPPTRGTLCSVFWIAQVSGITPAYAGNTEI